MLETRSLSWPESLSNTSLRTRCLSTKNRPNPVPFNVTPRFQIHGVNSWEVWVFLPHVLLPVKAQNVWGKYTSANHGV
jgi:hypothetical protein